MGLRITEVRTATVIGNYYWTYVRIYSGSIYGTGEGFFAPALESVIHELSRLIVGEDALEMNRLYDRLRWAATASGSSGINMHAISAIEIALMDLVAKHLNIPLYALLGGKMRDSVRIYVDTHAGKALEAIDPILVPIRPRWMEEAGVGGEASREPIHGRASLERYSEAYTPEEYARRAKMMKDEGYTAIKFDLDVPTPYTREYNRSAGALTSAEVGYLASLVAAVREAVGDEVDILFDLHWRLDLGSAIRLARAIEPYDVYWLEDPVPPENVGVIRQVASATKTPIATGENLYTRYGFLPLLGSGVRVLTPDGLKVGGLREMRLIADMATMHEVGVSPHNIASPLGTAAQAHAAATMPNFGVLEFHGHDVPIWWRMVRGRLIERGFIHLTDQPGIGVELDEKVAAKYAAGERFDL